VPYFSSSEAYDNFYNILNNVVDGGVASFKEYVIREFVDYLRRHVDDA
jgi:hypothetical protein